MLTNGDHLLDINGTRQWVGVHGAEHGTTPLLVLHGGPGAQNFLYERAVARLIGRDRTLVLHEQRGCGRSPGTGQQEYALPELVADVVCVIERLGAPVDLLGWSFGGDLAARVSLARPELVRRLVLQAPAVDFQAPEVADYLLAQIVELASADFRPAAGTTAHGPGTTWERILGCFEAMDADTAARQQCFRADRAAWAAEQWATVPEGLTSTNMTMLRSLTAQPLRDPIWADLPRIAAPTLVLTGAHDHNVDPARTERIAAAIPGAQLVTFPHSAHQPDVDVPEEYVAALLSFLSAPAPTNDPDPIA